MKTKSFFRTYTQADLASPGASSLDVVHGINRPWPVVQVWNVNGDVNAAAAASALHVDANTIRLRDGFISQPSGTFSIVVRVVG